MSIGLALAIKACYSAWDTRQTDWLERCHEHCAQIAAKGEENDPEGMTHQRLKRFEQDLYSMTSFYGAPSLFESVSRCKIDAIWQAMMKDG